MSRPSKQDEEMLDTGPLAFLKKAASGGPFGQTPSGINVAKINEGAKKRSAGEQLAIDIKRSRSTTWLMQIDEKKIVLDSATLASDAEPTNQKIINYLRQEARSYALTPS